MELRAATPADVDGLMEIDATIESTQYLHLEQSGEGLAPAFRLEPRPLREKLIMSNPVEEEHYFLFRQIVTGADEGIALVMEHEQALVASILARVDHGQRVLRVLDLRVDYEHRRQGLGTAMIFNMVQQARELELRAVAAETRTNNFPANQFLLKSSFDIAGVDTRRHSNHDIVKEIATLFWYAALD
jgi:ribosomal protein S18 acetylase RimI-like enzyme